MQVTGGDSGKEEGDRLPLAFGKFAAGETERFAVGSSKRLGEVTKLTIALDSFEADDKLFVDEVRAAFISRLPILKRMPSSLRCTSSDNRFKPSSVSSSTAG